jgi:hypothetical protein
MEISCSFNFVAQSQDSHSAFFFESILWWSQSDHDAQEDLARFGYKLNMKGIFKKHPSFLGYILELCIEISWLKKKFGQVLASQYLKEYLVISLLDFNSFLAICSQQKKRLLFSQVDSWGFA